MAGAGMVPGASAPVEPGAGGWCGVRKRTAADAGTSAGAGRIRRVAGMGSAEACDERERTAHCPMGMLDFVVDAGAGLLDLGEKIRTPAHANVEARFTPSLNVISRLGQPMALQPVYRGFPSFSRNRLFAL
jgi:hypothetical protein